MGTTIENIKADKQALERDITNLVESFIKKHSLNPRVNVDIEEVVFDSYIKTTTVKTKVIVTIC